MANLPIQPSETVIGADASFKGEMTFEGTVRLDGKFDGKLTSKGRLAVGKGAHLSGEVAVGSCTMDGSFKGTIVASEKVDLTAGAQVQGDIRSPRLVVAEGATLVGNVVISPDALKGSTEREAILGQAAAPHQAAYAHPATPPPQRR